MSLRFSSTVSRLVAEYGMLGVLLVLCVYYSWATWQQQHPVGKDAAQVLARELQASIHRRANVLIAAKTHDADLRFAESLASRLPGDRFEVVRQVNGSPVAIRQAVEQVVQSGTRIDVIAASSGTRLVVANVKKQLPALAETRIAVPEDYWWPTFLKRDNLISVADRVVVIAVIAVGMTMVIITGGIDLSVGSILALSAVATAWLVRGLTHGYEFQPLFHGGWLVAAIVLSLAGAGGLWAGGWLKRNALHTIGRLVLIASILCWLRVGLPYAFPPLLAVLGYLGCSPAGMALCCLLAIGLCAMIGGFSGSMITVFRVPPFIATLAVMLIARGLALRITRSESITGLPRSFDWLGLDSLGIWISKPAGVGFAVSNKLILLVIVYTLAVLVMSGTRLGRYIYAVGGNRTAARLSGIHVNRVLMVAYVVCGAMAGLGGVIEASQFTAGDPKSGMMYELDVIAAVVVGGTSLSGGEGKILGTLIGALIIAVILNGMNLTKVEPNTQKIVLGLIILGAVVLDNLRKRGWSGLAAS